MDDATPANSPDAPPPLPVPIEPLPPGAGLGLIYQSLLKHPERLIARLAGDNLRALTIRTTVAAILAWGLYGVIVGSFAGGVQWWAAPAKLAGGSVAVALLCLPSLYVFGCLSGADLRLGQAVAMSATCGAMTTLMLIGFAPVAWVFSQSTNSVFFMGLLHIGFWIIGVRFGLRLIGQTLKEAGASRTDYVVAWALVFVLTSLQMATALRPIVATSDTLLTSEKRFFASHWWETIQHDNDKTR